MADATEELSREMLDELVNPAAIRALFETSDPITYAGTDENDGTLWKLNIARSDRMGVWVKEVGHLITFTVKPSASSEFVTLCVLFGRQLHAGHGLNQELATLLKEASIDVPEFDTIATLFGQSVFGDNYTNFIKYLLDVARRIGRDGKAGVGWAVQQPQTRESIPNAFVSGFADVPNNPAIAGFFSAIRKGGPKAATLISGWQENSGQIVYLHRVKAGGQIVCYPDLAKAAGPLPTTEMLLKFVEGLSPLTADVALAVLAQLCEPSTGDRPKAPMLEPVKITVDTILQYKGSSSRGEDRQEQRKHIHDEMERLRALRFDIHRVGGQNPVTGKFERSGIDYTGDRLFDIVKVEHYQETLFGERDVIEVSWSVRAGHWAKWWLTAPDRVWVCQMARATLELDHRQQRPAHQLAKKISQLLIFTGPKSKEEPIVRRIDRLLEDAGELPVPAKRNSNWAGRTRDRFDNALLVLRDVGIIKSVEWENDKHGPGDPDRAKGWVTGWLNTKVTITLPEQAPVLPSQSVESLPAPAKTRKQGTKRSAKKSVANGADLRQARTARGWKQAALANHLGVSVPYLSQLETGKRAPSLKLATRIEKWIGT